MQYSGRLTLPTCSESTADKTSENILMMDTHTEAQASSSSINIVQGPFASMTQVSKGVSTPKRGRNHGMKSRAF
jgi:hypothetical protein